MRNHAMHNLTPTLYSVDSVIQLERLAIDQYAIPGYSLMRRAGQAVVDIIRQKFPVDKKILVLCGAGNNAGDGYVVARLAKQAGYAVNLISLIDAEKLTGDARQACQHWLECGEIQSYQPDLLEQADLIVDALLGTGLGREVSGEWARLIQTVNRSALPVIAVDVPSGLNADTGTIAGVAIIADYTVSFIGLKTGLFTGSGRACCGEIFFHGLDIPAEIYDRVTADVRLLNNRPPLLSARPQDMHKGQCGHVLIVGGNTNMAGAVILAAKAALRSGAGLVSVFTRAPHQMAVTIACPEAMVIGDNTTDHKIPHHLLSRVSHIAVGPGLGRDAWAEQCLAQCLQSQKPVVIDADALNLIAIEKTRPVAECVLTPHPGEAAQLLQMDTLTVNHDRLAAVKSIFQQYLSSSATEMAVILKGSGSLIYAGRRLSVCPYGNPAMATAGMGDVLTGVVAALMAQGLSPMKAAETAVLAHALAGDLAARGRSRGVLASDVIALLPAVL